MSLREDGTPRKKVNQEICQDPVRGTGSVCQVPGHTARAETPISSVSVYLCGSHSTPASPSVALWCVTAVRQTATTTRPYHVEEKPKCCLKCTRYRSLEEGGKSIPPKMRWELADPISQWAPVQLLVSPRSGARLLLWSGLRTRSWASASHKGFSERRNFCSMRLLKICPAMTWRAFVNTNYKCK